MAQLVEKTDEVIAFYKRLGVAIIDEERWRRGQVSLFAIQVGEHRINVHPPALWSLPDFTLRAPNARLMAIVWPLLLLGVFFPLAVHRDRRLSR